MHEPHDPKRDEEYHRYRGREVDYEVHEGELVDHRTDDDVRRVADERCGAPYVRGEDLDYEVRERVLLHDASDHQRHGEHKKHGGDIVEERRQDGGDEGEVDKDQSRAPPRGLRALYGEVPEDPGILEDAHQDHHPYEEPQGLPVNRLYGLLLADGP